MDLTIKAPAPAITSHGPGGNTQAQLHCPMCTHSVPGLIEYVGRKKVRVVPGQKCRRCHSLLDAAAVLYLSNAA